MSEFCQHSNPSPSHSVGAWCNGGCGEFVNLDSFTAGPHESYLGDLRVNDHERNRWQQRIAELEAALGKAIHAMSDFNEHVYDAYWIDANLRAAELCAPSKSRSGREGAGEVSLGPCVECGEPGYGVHKPGFGAPRRTLCETHFLALPGSEEWTKPADQQMKGDFMST